ncbi:UvrD-helicase domain-containing protein [Lysinibacillus capsici]|uniref:UvrD-helicase domain-containing protein n=1 Tax=Lysinibacillus capsici TaxID=2115968 RepID=UPI002E244112|nr:UvrD-helicase domain-containing protein [Lysinibacillus capsici]
MGNSIYIILFMCSLIIIYYSINLIRIRKKALEMEAIEKAKELRQEKLKQLELLISPIIKQIKQFDKDKSILSNYYIANTESTLLKDNYQNIFNQIKELPELALNNWGVLKKFREQYLQIDDWVQKANDIFIQKELNELKSFFQNIDNKSLDLQQQIATVTNEDNTLILAGAGSGKTLTISAKVKYLVERLGVHPDEILLISFTSASAEEMTERIQKKLGIPITAKTFHKLGLNIITAFGNVRPEISEMDLEKTIQHYFSENVVNNKQKISDIVNFYSMYLNVPKDLEEFDTLGEFHQDQSTYNLVTLKSKIENNEAKLKQEHRTLNLERVKSLEEVIIANFLFLNGIRYEYEYLYPFKADKDKYRKAYRPDFYLPDYDIYLEHFGITQDYRTPWLSKIEEAKYVEGIHWKRKLHQENNTTLIETYSYLNKDGVLLKVLKQLLQKQGVQFNTIDLRVVYKRIALQQNEERQFKELKKLINSFITLFKSNGFTEKDFLRIETQIPLIKSHFIQERTKLFLSIVKPVYSAYQEHLKKQNAIDFNDMINIATQLLTVNSSSSYKYKYIIIDEFQDISMGRYRLVKAIKDKTKAKVMAVGDDWQSIYRFAGSDLELFIQFEEYFGYTKLLKIEQTYRNSQELINVAAKFVKKNPKQFNKEPKSAKSLLQPIKIYGYDKDILTAFIKAIDDIVQNFGENAEIMILGRNTLDLKYLIEKDIDKRFIYSSSANAISCSYNKYPNVKFSFSTVHRSKGLEGENVIIINLVNHLIGFPNKISDDPVLSYVLTNADQFPYSEERRLFYVALTRTKNYTYLIPPQSGTSVFVEELIKEHNIKFNLITGESQVRDNPNCPKCSTGKLVLKQNQSDKRKFVGCSNYPGCSNTYKEIDILKNPILCIKCQGYMVKRNGKYGLFYGCVNFPECENKIKKI